MNSPFPPAAPGLARVGTFPRLRAEVGARGAAGRWASRVRPGQAWEPHLAAAWASGLGAGEGRREAGARGPGRPGAGQRLEPKVKSEGLRLAGHARGSRLASPSLGLRSCPCDLSILLPKNMPKGDGVNDKRMAGVGEEGRLWSK